MTAFSDSQVLTATVSSTSETQLGTINIPAGRSYQITNHPTVTGATITNSESILISGPSELSAYISNTAATSTACKLMVEYIDSGAN